MGFWIFMIVMDLLIPCVMAGAGRAFMVSAPKTINPVFGYRTARSMKNEDTWTFAHAYIGKLWFFTGLILIPLTVIPMVLVVNQETDTVAKLGTMLCFLELAMMLLTIIPTETALRATFDENGERRIVTSPTEGEALLAVEEGEVAATESDFDEEDAFFAEPSDSSDTVNDAVQDMVQEILQSMKEDKHEDDIFEL